MNGKHYSVIQKGVHAWLLREREKKKKTGVQSQTVPWKFPAKNAVCGCEWRSEDASVAAPVDLISCVPYYERN